MSVPVDKNLPLVVVVEDDPYGLEFLESSLERAGYRVLSATSIKSARNIILETGLANIMLVLTDYRLPNGTGIDLIRWVRQFDSTLATMIITAQGEKSVVQETMNAGAVDYLEKPVTHQVLSTSVKRAIEHTRKQRKFAADQKGLADLEQLDFLLKSPLDVESDEQLSVFYHPLHEVGGDFLNTFKRNSDGSIILIGDVSGHDIRSGYVSTYFHGMFKGCIESGASVDMAVNLFNKSLNDQYKQDDSEFPRISLSMAVLDIRPVDRVFLHWNYGFNPIQIIDKYGFAKRGLYGNSPLGWISSITPKFQTISFDEAAIVYLYTDGLVDYAEELEISLFSLLYVLMQDKESLNGLPTTPSDDILVIRYQTKPNKEVNSTFEPILNEQYSGSEVEHIDHLQSVWRRSLVFAMQDQLGDRLYDLLIAIREGMLNALTHGCDRAPDKFAHLHISYDKENTTVRVRIDDPGKGHDFDLAKRLEEMGNTGGKHLGLGIIQHLSDSFEIDNSGSSLIFDFKIDPTEETD